MTTAPTATFQHLSFELRARIWELTVEPRIVEVHVVYHHPNKQLPPMRHLRSSTSAPAQLQTCREAREHLTRHPNVRYWYEKAFSEITTTPYEGFDPVPEDDPQRERYVWLNFDNDMVSIGDTDLSDFRAVAYQVRRLRLERALSCEYFCHTESLLIGNLFRNLVEIHLVCLEGIRSGYMAAEDLNCPCGPENVYFVDPEEVGGMMLNSVDLDALVVREYEEKLNEPGQES
ncbi:hypothetical protein BKA65DRAFT_158080 [Rhexocercosporidium sp. MPI-PUGE-AT-0058]|nr:hypothetical protein BKA65DRAFT_158080 [Rhexocercosporidium sp. MPI-PUGE-AT-0058]